MSEQNWTREPWYVGAMNDCLFVIDQPPRPSNDDVNPDREVVVIAKLDYPHADANAERIVACVNACQGIPTQALRAGFVRRAVEAIKAYKEEYLCGSWTEDGPPDADRVAALVRAALALLENKP